MDLLLGIDIGTTSLKVGIFAPDGSCLGVERREYKLETPSAERAELDANLYWEACVQTVRKLLNRVDGQGQSIRALSVSSQGETVITLDASGKPIYPTIVWLDNRAVSQAEFLSSQFKEQVYRRTGIAEIVPTWPACKVLWLKENEPEVFNKAAKFVLVQDYLIYRLTGSFITDGSVACTTLFFDIVRNAWWEEMLAAVGIRKDQLPEIVMPGSCVGNLEVQAAHELGLPADVKVINGGMDQVVGAIGAGNIHSGIISETTGAALAIQVVVEDPLIDKNQSVPVYVHSVPGQYLLVPVCPTGGMAFKWFRDQFGEAEIQKSQSKEMDSYNLLTELAASIPAGSDGLIMLPHLMGAFSPEINPYARGSFVGFTIGHTRAHFVRALLEGVAFMLKRNVEYIEQVGIEVREIVSTGGGSRSHLWNRIKADVCNKKIITLKNEETALIGNAILAGVANGLFKSISEGCRAMVSVQEEFQPDQDVGAYEFAYRRYCALDQELSDFYRSYYAEK